MLVRLAAEAGSKEELVLQEKGTDLILNLLLDREVNQQKLSLRRSMQCRLSYLLSELPYKIGELMEDAKIICKQSFLIVWNVWKPSSQSIIIMEEPTYLWDNLSFRVPRELL